MKRRWAGLVLAAMVLLGAAPGTSSAAPSSSGDSAAAACRVTTPWGYVGWKMCGTKTLVADWSESGGGREYFIVAPDRVIWHTWGGAGSWHRLANGRADDLQATGYSPTAERYRTVFATVNGSGRWCSMMTGSSWTNWFRCQHW